MSFSTDTLADKLIERREVAEPQRKRMKSTVYEVNTSLYMIEMHFVIKRNIFQLLCAQELR